jgi:8-oxo-dGTP diphosphatase
LSDGALRVSVGLLTDAAGRYLVNRRRPETHMAGAWEFPGGKRRPGESADEALKRELSEELGIAVLAAEPLLVIAHDYGDRRVELDVFHVRAYSGTASSREGQVLRWVELAEMDRIGLLAADRPIVERLRHEARLSTNRA